MKKGVITVYLSLVTLLMVSLILACLESARFTVAENLSARYANMAGEMLLSAYTKPLADRYGLFVLDSGAKSEKLSMYEYFLGLNLEAQEDEHLLMALNAKSSDIKYANKVSMKDNNFAMMKQQISRFDKYRLMVRGIDKATELVKNGWQEEIREVKDDFESDLDAGNNKEAETPDLTDVAKAPKVTDPRGGVGKWIKSGILNLSMGDKKISTRSINVSNCSYSVSQTGFGRILSDFTSYDKVKNYLAQSSVEHLISDGIQGGSNRLMINDYVFDRFKKMQSAHKITEETVLDYEVEYLIAGKKTDRDNLESVMSELFALRVLLNLAYLYGSSGKDAILEEMAASIALTSLIPVAGEAVKMMLMICWASAEAMTDLSALAHGQKVPIFKDSTTWNLTMGQLVNISKYGGGALSYVKNGKKGLSYEQYLMLLVGMVPEKTLLTRMTQLMESNVQMAEGFEDFRFENCITKLTATGKITWQPLFGGYKQSVNKSFEVKLSY